MNQDYIDITIHLVVALVIGGAIGLERSYRGRSAGFRTHVLVCIASSALMLVTLYQSTWLPAVALDTVRADPTRMAQGIMTGIGFLGAGVIIKEGWSVRGLTTAASIWVTSAIGILVGIGFYFPAAVTTVLALGTLSAFHWIESKMPTQLYARHRVRFPRDAVMSEPELRALITGHDFTLAHLSYRLSKQGSYFEYDMLLRTLNASSARRLAEAWRSHPAVIGFNISPIE